MAGTVGRGGETIPWSVIFDIHRKSFASFFQNEGNVEFRGKRR